MDLVVHDIANKATPFPKDVDDALDGMCKLFHNLAVARSTAGMQFRLRPTSLITTADPLIFGEITKEGEIQALSDLRNRFSPIVKRWLTDYPNVLKDIRQSVGTKTVCVQNIESIQEGFTCEYQNILKRMLAEAVSLIGEPPCSYAWFGLGSYSRGEILPYSDIEYLWLFNETDIFTRQYFRLLHGWILLQLRCVGEGDGFNADAYPEVNDEGDPNNLVEIAEGVYKGCRGGVAGTYTQVVSNLSGRFIAGNKKSLWRDYETALRTIFLVVCVSPKVHLTS